jgi:hypothetical protein
MKKKRKISLQNIFNIISILVLTILFIYFLYRFIYYKKESEKSKTYSPILAERIVEQNKELSSGKYLTKKVGEIAQAGANVIFERGLWTKEDREKTVKYYRDRNIECEIHYVSVDDEIWKKNIAERNKRVEDGNGGSDFYLDEGLMKKLESFWEEPTEDEIDVVYKVSR